VPVRSSFAQSLCEFATAQPGPGVDPRCASATAATKKARVHGAVRTPRAPPHSRPARGMPPAPRPKKTAGRESERQSASAAAPRRGLRGRRGQGQQGPRVGRCCYNTARLEAARPGRSHSRGHAMGSLGDRMTQCGFGPWAFQKSSGNLGAYVSLRSSGAHSSNGGSDTSA